MGQSVSTTDIGERIVVVGTTGSGKSWLASHLAERLGLPHVELDALFWDPHWTPAPQFRERVAAAVAGAGWVVDGNYRAIRDLTWPRAQTIVWLDYGLGTIYRRLIPRIYRRIQRKEVLWNGNRERLWMQFKWDGLLVWVMRTYWRRRREYPRLLASYAYRHLRLVRLRSPAETACWLESLNETRRAAGGSLNPPRARLRSRVRSDRPPG